MDENQKLLARLALALVENPRASLQELAKAAGTSKATLYRLCPTRERLIQHLLEHSNRVFDEIIEKAELNTAPPLQALRKLILLNLGHRELLVFMMHYLKDFTLNWEADSYWEKSMDAFFLKGQQSGDFRIDITAATMTEIWGSIIIGFVDAERRGRIARATLPQLIENTVLSSIQKR